jgi:hypothetical protein
VPLQPAEIVVDGACTLVDAIHSANGDTPVGGCVAGSGDDEILLTADVVLTESVDGVNGLPPITSGITLRGNGFEVSRDPDASEFRILAVPDTGFSGVVAVEDVSLTGGSLSNDDGGAIKFYSFSANMVLTNVTLSGNRAEAGGGLYVGWGYVDVEHSAFYDNYAAAGGAIFKAYGGYLDLISSTLSGNTASVSGGGLDTTGGWYPFGQPGFTYVSGTTVSGNSAGYGGGILAFGGLYMTNSTVSGNYATDAGGGLRAWTDFYQANSLTHSTITGNSTGSGLGGGLYNTSLAFVPDELIAEGSIVAGNSDNNCWLDGLDIDDRGLNFDDDGTCGSGWSFLTGLDPSLEDNGGPTKTHALASDSNAVNAGPCALELDQRGLGRNDGACDGGAFELGAGSLSLVGACPGSMTILATGATPDTVMELFQGPSEGASQVPTGVCVGTELGVTSPTSVGTLATDSGGNGSLGLQLGSGDCAQFLQGVTESDCATTNVAPIDGCDLLTLTHTGEGTDPAPLPVSSPGCPTSTYLPGEVISLTASPGPGWDVGSWQGTDNDGSTSSMNSVTMPEGPHAVVVNYDRVCQVLTVGKTGTGSIPQASPSSSPGCPPSSYEPETLIQLSGAHADPGWTIGGWTGTEDDASTDSANTVVMPDKPHQALVNYVLICGSLRARHTGAGADPLVSPASSPECAAGEYVAGEVIDLTALPIADWEVLAWHGTDDDGSTATTNTLTMPFGDHSVLVDYAPRCSTLTAGHSGSGADPVVSPLPNGDWLFSRPASLVASSIRVADVDGDQDPDIVTGSSTTGGTNWLENSAGDGTSWVTHPVSALSSFRVFAVDLDGDGDTDIAGTVETDLIWFENTLGDGTSWATHTVPTSFDPDWVHAADLDGDGHQDLLAGSISANTVAWWNNETGDGLNWSQQTLTTNLPSAWSVIAADVDGDEDLDVLAAGNRILWWENAAGDGSSWVERLIVDGVGATKEIAATDMDGDSDPDLVAAHSDDDRISWYENDVAVVPSLWTPHQVTASFSDPARVVPIDIDSDTDVDVVATSTFPERFVWFENLAGDELDWLEHEIAKPLLSLGIAAADLSADGGPDVVGSGGGLDLWTNSYDAHCSPGSFAFSDGLSLTAAPDPGWEVAGWNGTVDDAGTELTNLAVMPSDEHTVSVDYVESAPTGLTLSMTGSCPGPIDVMVTQAEPNRSVVLYAGGDEGTTTIPGGACAGTELGLAPARRWKKLTADGNGEASLTFTSGAAWCSRSVQAVDGSCATSNVVDLP